MNDKVLVLNDKKNNLISKNSKEPIMFDGENIDVISCIAIPKGFKIDKIDDLKVEYIIDDSSLSIVEGKEEIEVEMLNKQVSISVKSIKLIGTLNFISICKGFFNTRDSGEDNQYIEFSCPDSVNINKSICYFLNDVDIGYDLIKNIYKLVIKNREINILLQNRTNGKIIYQDESIVIKQDTELICKDLNKKYIIVNATISIVKR